MTKDEERRLFNAIYGTPKPEYPVIETLAQELVRCVDLGVEDLKRRYPNMSDEDFQTIISLFKEVIDRWN